MNDSIIEIILQVISGVERALGRIAPHMITPFIVTCFIYAGLKRFINNIKILRYIAILIFFVLLVIYITFLVNFGILWESK